VTPSPVTVIAGRPAAYTATVLAQLTGAVTLSISRLPTGVTSQFATNPVTMNRNSAATALTLNTAVTTTPGTYNFTVSGTIASGTLNPGSAQLVVRPIPCDLVCDTQNDRPGLVNSTYVASPACPAGLHCQDVTVDNTTYSESGACSFPHEINTGELPPYPTTITVPGTPSPLHSSCAP
jgi:hypothetical protein